MEYSVYTQLVANGVSPTDARKFCSILAGVEVNSGQVTKEDDTFTYRSREISASMDVCTTVCWLNYPQDGEKYVRGYHIGKGYYNTNFTLGFDGKYTICVYDRSHRTLFDTQSELWIVTNQENVFNSNEPPETKALPHFYHFSPAAVNELEGRTRGTTDYFGPFDTITIDRFAKIGINPDNITIWPNDIDQFEYVGKFVADKDYKKEETPQQ